MKKYWKQARPYDFIIVFSLVLLSFLPSVVFAVNNHYEKGDDIYAVISIKGEEVDRFLLTGNDEHKLVTYNPYPGKYNIVEIDGERIRNKEDNSPQQVAVRTGWVQYPGEISINIPHQLVIEIVSDNPQAAEIDVLAQ